MLHIWCIYGIFILGVGVEWNGTENDEKHTQQFGSNQHQRNGVHYEHTNEIKNDEMGEHHFAQ